MFIDGKLDREPATLPERLEQPTIADLVPGTSALVDEDAIWVLEDSSSWIDCRAPLTLATEEWETYVHVIAFDEGLVVDIISGSHKKPVAFSRASAKETAEDESYDASTLVPVIGWITHEQDLAKVSELFQEKYSIPLFPDQKKKRRSPTKKAAVKSEETVTAPTVPVTE